jgi:predicted transglutaminase-like cysteine proteinase
MSLLARAAQACLLIIAAVICHGAATVASPATPSAVVEFQKNQMVDSQTAPKTLPDHQLAIGSLPQFAMLAPSASGQGDGFVPTTSEPFNIPTIIALPSDVSEKWLDVRSRLITEEKILDACRSSLGTCPAAARRLLSIIELGRGRNGRVLLGRINRAVNLSIRPMTDLAQYGVEDYWATPLETLSSGAGDCEDYAIVKYVALRESGIVPDDLRLVIVRDMKGVTDHAVLAVHDDDSWLILDNRTLTMVHAEQAVYYQPLFVLDQRGARTFVSALARRLTDDVNIP